MFPKCQWVQRLFSVQETISSHPNLLSAMVTSKNVLMACCRRNVAKEMADFTSSSTNPTHETMRICSYLLTRILDPLQPGQTLPKLTPPCQRGDFTPCITGCWGATFYQESLIAIIFCGGVGPGVSFLDLHDTNHYSVPSCGSDIHGPITVIWKLHWKTPGVLGGSSHFICK